MIWNHSKKGWPLCSDERTIARAAGGKAGVDGPVLPRARVSNSARTRLRWGQLRLTRWAQPMGVVDSS